MQLPVCYRHHIILTNTCMLPTPCNLSNYLSVTLLSCKKQAQPRQSQAVIASQMQPRRVVRKIPPPPNHSDNPLVNTSWINIYPSKFIDVIKKPFSTLIRLAPWSSWPAGRQLEGGCMCSCHQQQQRQYSPDVRDCDQ